jgi:hypothetical protein
VTDNESLGTAASNGTTIPTPDESAVEWGVTESLGSAT